MPMSLSYECGGIEATNTSFVLITDVGGKMRSLQGMVPLGLRSRPFRCSLTLLSHKHSRGHCSICSNVTTMWRDLRETADVVSIWKKMLFKALRLTRICNSCMIQVAMACLVCDHQSPRAYRVIFPENPQHYQNNGDS